jgi:hypothetical protein
MPAQPNIGNLHRLLYIGGGLGLMAAGFFWIEQGWLRYAMPIGGAALLVEGLIGW